MTNTKGVMKRVISVNSSRSTIDILRFYWIYLKQFLKYFFVSLGLLGSLLYFVNIILLVVLSSNQTWLDLVSERRGVSPYYAFIPFGLAAIYTFYRLLQFNYERFRTLEQENDELRDRNSTDKLTNRDSLIRAIAKYSNATIIYLGMKHNYNRQRKSNPHLVNVGLSGMVDIAYAELASACRTLIEEKLVAGSNFFKPIDNFESVINRRIKESDDLSRDHYSDMSEIRAEEKKTIEKIDTFQSIKE